MHLPVQSCPVSRRAAVGIDVCIARRYIERQLFETGIVGHQRHIEFGKYRVRRVLAGRNASR